MLIKFIIMISPIISPSMEFSPVSPIQSTMQANHGHHSCLKQLSLNPLSKSPPTDSHCDDTLFIPDPLSPPTMVSTHCDCPATVYLIYTTEHGSVQLKNGLIQHNSKMYLIIFLKIPSDRLCLGASFLR